MTRQISENHPRSKMDQLFTVMLYRQKVNKNKTIDIHTP